MTDTTNTLTHDAAGFLIGNAPLNPSKAEISLLNRLREEIRMFRGLFAKKDDAQQDDAPQDGGGAGGATVTPATPRLTSAGVQSKPLAMPELGKIATPVGSTAAAIVVNVNQPVATPQRVTPENPLTDRALPKLDTNGKPIPQPAPAKPMLNRPAKNADPVTTAGTAPDATDSKVRDLLGDIKDKIGNAVDLSGGEEVDPNIKAAQEIAGVAGGALNGIKAVGGVLGTVATPMLSGAKGLFKPKATDAPTPWFKRFYNELRGLRREESVFNRAQLRTLKEIEAKPGEGKGGGGFMGMLMMLAGPLIAAIGAALTAGFGLLMKLPGMGLLAKLATGLMPAALMPKKPITQPTAVPGTPDAPAGQTGQKKPSLWERTKSKVSGWMGKGTPASAPAVPVQEIQGPPKPPGRLAKAANAVKRMAKVLPVVGRLMTLFSVTTSVAESEGDDSLSRGEKDKRAGSAIGGGVGGVVGGALGAMVAGPLGAIVGSVVGDKVGAIVGEKVGGWVTELRNADIPGKLMAGWAALTSTLGEGFNAVLKKLGLSGVVDKVKEAYSGAKDKAAELSLEAKRGYSQATGKPIELNEAEANAARRQAAQADTRRTDGGQPQERGFLGTLAEGAGRVAGRAASSLTGKKFEGFGSDVDGHIAEASKRYGLPEDVLRGFVKMEGGWTGAMSPTGAIGTGQFVKGTWDSLAKTKDGQDIGMKTIGSDFRTPNDPRFDNRTNTLATGLLAKKNADTLTKAGLPATGENLYMLHNIGPGVIPALKGSNNVTPETVQAMRHNGLKDGMTATDFVSFQKGRFNQAYAEANAPNVNTANKAPATMAAPAMATVKPVTVTNAAPAIPAAPAMTAVVTAGARAIPQMPSIAVEAPKVPDFQPVTAGLASTMGNGQEQRPSVIVVGNKTPVGRDLSNRPLAHIVTGGLSGA